MSNISDLYREGRGRGSNPLAVQGGSLRLQPDANATALWWFNEGSGTLLNDKKGSNNATLSGSPTWGSGGPFASDLAFNGSSQYGTLASKIDFTTAFTIEALVKKTAGGNEGQIIHGSDGHFSAPNYGNAWRMSIGWEDDFNCLFYNGSANQTVQSTSTVCDGLYHYLVARLGSNTLDLFKDGVNVGTGAVSGSVAATAYMPSIARGQNGAASYSGYLLGSIAIIRLSAAARPDAEILTNAKLMGFA